MAQLEKNNTYFAYFVNNGYNTTFVVCTVSLKTLKLEYMHTLLKCYEHLRLQLELFVTVIYACFDP